MTSAIFNTTNFIMECNSESTISLLQIGFVMEPGLLDHHYFSSIVCNGFTLNMMGNYKCYTTLVLLDNYNDYNNVCSQCSQMEHHYLGKNAMT